MISIQRSERFRVALTLAVLALLYFVAILSLCVVQYENLTIAKGVDQVYLTEAITNTLHGSFFHHTHAVSNLSGFGEMDHFFPILLLFLPFFAIYSKVTTLFFISSLGLTVTGVVVYHIAWEFFRDRHAAVLAAVAFWTMPGINYIAITGSWPELWALPYFALLFLFYLRDRSVAFWVTSIFFMACMEHLLVYVAIFAACEVFWKRRLRWLLGPIACAGAWMIVLWVFANDFSAGRFQTYDVMFSFERLGGVLSSLVLNSYRSPLIYIFWLWPLMLLFAAPPMVVMIAWATRVGFFDYQADGDVRFATHLFFFVLLGGVRGIRSIAEVLASRFPRFTPMQLTKALLVLVIAVHALSITRLGVENTERFKGCRTAEWVWDIIDQLPEHSRVVSNREFAYAFFGVVDAYITLLQRGDSFVIDEYMFDDDNAPLHPYYSDVGKFRTKGIWTPNVFVLENHDGQFTPVSATFIAVYETIDEIHCYDHNGDGLVEVIYAGTNGIHGMLQGLQHRLVPVHPPGPPPMPSARERGKKLFSRGRRGGTGTTLKMSGGDGCGGLEIELQRAVGAVCDDGYVQEIIEDDFNGDGLRDLLVLDSENYLIRPFVRVDGGMIEMTPIPAPPIPGSIAVCDIDADGDKDLVVTKTNLLWDLDGLERFFEKEGVTDILWYPDSNLPRLLEHFEGRRKWLLDQQYGVLYLKRR